MTVLMTRDLTKIYGGKKGTSSTKALSGINMEVTAGEFIGVMGPSGSGKTTLLNILGGINKPTSGVVEIEGKSVGMMSKNQLALFRRQRLGFIFQEFNLLDSLSVKENIMLPMVLDRKAGDEMERKAVELMELFEIHQIANKYPYQVSGGQQQRTAVARALINDPAIVLADEPTGNLDSKSSTNVMETLQRINEARRSTILMVTHDPFAASFCSRVVFIKDGAVYMELVRKEDRKRFFDRILDCLAVLGGERNDI